MSNKNAYYLNNINITCFENLINRTRCQKRKCVNKNCNEWSECKVKNVEDGQLEEGEDRWVSRVFIRLFLARTAVELFAIFSQRHTSQPSIHHRTASLSFDTRCRPSIDVYLSIIQSVLRPNDSSACKVSLPKILLLFPYRTKPVI